MNRFQLYCQRDEGYVIRLGTYKTFETAVRAAFGKFWAVDAMIVPVLLLPGFGID